MVQCERQGDRRFSIGLGIINEYRSERAVEAQHSQICHRVTVLRDARSELAGNRLGRPTREAASNRCLAPLAVVEKSDDPEPGSGPRSTCPRQATSVWVPLVGPSWCWMHWPGPRAPGPQVGCRYRKYQRSG